MPPKPYTPIDPYMPSGEFLDRWKEIDLELLKIFFQHSQRRLEETIKTAELHTSRAYQYLSISVPVVTASLGYLVSQRHDNEPDEKLFVWSAFLVLILFCGSLVETVRCLLPYDFAVPGTEPQYLLKTQFIEGLEGVQQLRNFLFSECVTYQDRINKNDAINAKRLTHVSRSLFLMIFTPATILLSWLILLCSGQS